MNIKYLKESENFQGGFSEHENYNFKVGTNFQSFKYTGR